MVVVVDLWLMLSWNAQCCYSGIHSWCYQYQISS